MSKPEPKNAKPNAGEVKAAPSEFGSLEAAKKSVDRSSATDRDGDRDSSLRKAEIETAIARQHLENESINQRHQDQIADRDMRFTYSKWVFYYLVAYSVFVGLLILTSGLEELPFKLDTEVLKYLVGSTAVSAIGLVAAVTTGLFHKK